MKTDIEPPSHEDSRDEEGASEGQRRQYPKRPIVAVGAAVCRLEDPRDARVLIVRRGKAPSKMANEFDLLEIVAQVPRKDVEYDPKMLGGELGPYVPKKA